MTFDAPVGVPDSFEEHVGLMFDLLALAYQADVTRVFSFMLSRELSQRTYPQIGVTEQHHSVSHHGNDAQKIAQNVKVNTYHATLFARFLDKLRSTPDGDGSILDHSLIIYGGGMGNPNPHASDPLPVASQSGAASAKGIVISSSRHGHRSETCGWRSRIDTAVRLESFGDSNGRVDGCLPEMRPPIGDHRRAGVVAPAHLTPGGAPKRCARRRQVRESEPDKARPIGCTARDDGRRWPVTDSA